MEQSWVTIARFFLHAEALLARMRLESSGIECLLQDEHVSRMHSLAAPAIGGIKLQVPEEDAARAQAILNEWPARPFIVESSE
jgi:hypothetical protein